MGKIGGMGSSSPKVQSMGFRSIFRGSCFERNFRIINRGGLLCLCIIFVRKDVLKSCIFDRKSVSLIIWESEVLGGLSFGWERSAGLAVPVLKCNQWVFVVFFAGHVLRGISA